MYYFVYETTNLINGKTYIGCHQTVDLNDGYLGSGTVLKLAIDKYGRDNFKREILGFATSRQKMLELEGRLVTENHVASDTTYNLVLGGGVSPVPVEKIIQERKVVAEKKRQAAVSPNAAQAIAAMRAMGVEPPDWLLG